MPPTLTIAYMTSRKEPRIEWFLDSVHNEMEKEGLLDSVLRKIIVVDRWKEERPPQLLEVWHGDLLKWVGVKPSVWQGPARLVNQDWFAAANARNTALCFCDTSHLAYTDDLSVLLPGWLKSAREAMGGNYIACGAYRKVKGLVVENGIVKSFTLFPQGEDNRLKHVTQDVTQCGGNWLYGCSLVAPVEALLSVNGWPEDLCDGHGFEDVCMGIVLKNAGYDIRYDRRMMTYESEEDHHKEPAFTRKDFHFENGVAVEGGNGKTDKSHAALNIALASRHFPNSFGEGGIRALRQKTLAGEPWPIPTAPDREWFTGKLLSEL